MTRWRVVDLMELLDDFQPYAGIVVAVIGAVLVFMGQQRSSSEVAAPSSDPNRNDPATG